MSVGYGDWGTENGKNKEGGSSSKTHVGGNH